MEDQTNFLGFKKLSSNRFIADPCHYYSDNKNTDSDVELIQSQNNYNDKDFEYIISDHFKGYSNEGQIIEGVIIGIDKDDAIIDAGLKSEGRVSLKEFELGENHEKVEIGDKVKVYLEKIEGRNGNIILSREKAIKDELWIKLEECEATKTEVEGVIFGSIKCGYTVDIGGVVAFLPASHVDLRPVKDINPLLGKKQKFRILKMDKKQGNIVVSRKAILEASHVDARNNYLNQLTEGQIITGKVKSITSYGVFVEIHESNEVGVVDGLLHITDISWQRVSHPSAVFSCGQDIKVKIIKIDRATGRISLGVKQLEDSPWHDIESRYPIGSVHKGTVTSIEDYGLFVELGFGIEGLVHVSEISWTKNSLPINQMFTRGKEVHVKILNIDTIKNRMSLSIKRCYENPWQTFVNKHPLGSILSVTVKNVVDFGIFVSFKDSDLDPDVDGLIYITDLTWDKNPEEEIKNYSAGDEIQVKVLMVNINKGRISLGIKQIHRDPFEDFLRKVNLGDKIPVTITKIEDNGVLVDVANGTNILIEQEYLPENKKYSPGDKVEAEILSIETYNLILSLK